MSENAVHVTPCPDDPEHRLDGFCWCQPSVEVEIGGVVYVHRRTLDSPRREDVDQLTPPVGPKSKYYDA